MLAAFKSLANKGIGWFQTIQAFKDQLCLRIADNFLAAACEIWLICFLGPDKYMFKAQIIMIFAQLFNAFSYGSITEQNTIHYFLSISILFGFFTFFHVICQEMFLDQKHLFLKLAHCIMGQV